MQLQFQIFPNCSFMQLQFFFCRNYFCISFLWKGTLRLSTLHSSPSLSSLHSPDLHLQLPVWVVSERSTLCASANEELDSFVNNAPLTGYEPKFFDGFHYSETTEIFIQESSSDIRPSYLHDSEISDDTIGRALSSPQEVHVHEDFCSGAPSTMHLTALLVLAAMEGQVVAVGDVLSIRHRWKKRCTPNLLSKLGKTQNACVLFQNLRVALHQKVDGRQAYPDPVTRRRVHHRRSGRHVDDFLISVLYDPVE